MNIGQKIVQAVTDLVLRQAEAAANSVAARARAQAQQDRLEQFVQDRQHLGETAQDASSPVQALIAHQISKVDDKTTVAMEQAGVSQEAAHEAVTQQAKGSQVDTIRVSDAAKRLAKERHQAS